MPETEAKNPPSPTAGPAGGGDPLTTIKPEEYPSEECPASKCYYLQTRAALFDKLAVIEQAAVQSAEMAKATREEVKAQYRLLLGETDDIFKPGGSGGLIPEFLKVRGRVTAIWKAAIFLLTLIGTGVIAALLALILKV